MIKVNFFAKEHRREPLKQNAVLGICDPEGESPAYTTLERGEDKWCATIYNSDGKHMLFVAIDKNIDIRKADGNQESRCDGMIFVPDTMELSFVELKDSRAGYISSAEGQLLKTLECFLANHHYEDYHNRRAYACNPTHPHFAYSAKLRINEFYKQTHFRRFPLPFQKYCVSLHL